MPLRDIQDQTMLLIFKTVKNHMSYYTALSRSATADGTIIVQGFDPSNIMGGANGYIRQEFRELELLDQITKLRYENALPDDIDGHRRNL